MQTIKEKDVQNPHFDLLFCICIHHYAAGGFLISQTKMCHNKPAASLDQS